MSRRVGRRAVKVDLGDLLWGLLEDPEVIDGSVRAGVAGTQHAREPLVGPSKIAEQGMRGNRSCKYQPRWAIATARSTRIAPRSWGELRSQLAPSLRRRVDQARRASAQTKTAPRQRPDLSRHPDSYGCLAFTFPVSFRPWDGVVVNRILVSREVPGPCVTRYRRIALALG